MRFRFVAIGLVTLLLAAGAVHFPPLWLFVVVTPVWLELCFVWEEERIRATILNELEAARQGMWRDEASDDRRA